MTMTDEEILSAAARLRAARRRRVAKTCEVCGAPFEGIAQRRYCSDACRVRASRARHGVDADTAHGFPEPRPAGAAAEPPRGDGEPLVANYDRIGEANMRAGAFTENTTETVLRERDRLDETVDPDEAFPTRHENESAVAYFRRLRAYNGRNGIFTDESTELLRQSREERSAELLRAAGLDPSDEA